jgi:hypothetical protein
MQPPSPPPRPRARTLLPAHTLAWSTQAARSVIIFRRHWPWRQSPQPLPCRSALARSCCQPPPAARSSPARRAAPRRAAPRASIAAAEAAGRRARALGGLVLAVAAGRTACARRGAARRRLALGGRLCHRHGLPAVCEAALGRAAGDALAPRVGALRGGRRGRGRARVSGSRARTPAGRLLGPQAAASKRARCLCTRAEARRVPPPLDIPPPPPPPGHPPLRPPSPSRSAG